MAHPERLTLRRTLGAWAIRTTPSPGEMAYIAYCVVLVGLIVGAPVVRAIWILLAEPPVFAVVMSPIAQSLLAAAVLVLLASVCAAWSAPVVRRGFLASVLADSAIRYSRSFRTPVMLWMLAAIAVCVGSAAVFFSVLWALGAIDAVGFACALAGALGVAITAWAAAILTQSSARFGAFAALILTSAAVGLALGRPTWAVGLLWSPLWAVVMLTMAFALGIWAVPRINRLRPTDITAASLRRDAATTGFVLMESDDVARAMRDLPTAGRHWPATPRLPIVLALPYAALIGAARTPARFVRGVLCISMGYVVAGLAPSVWLVGIAVTLVYLGLGSVTDGLRNAADVVRSAPAYGVSDVRLFTSHALLPLAVAGILAPLAFTTGGLSGFATALVCTIAAVAARAFAALTPMAPLSLLIPIPTPVGDMAAMMRLVWAVQGLAFAIAFAVLCAPIISDPSANTALMAIAATGIACWVLISRWRTRS